MDSGVRFHPSEIKYGRTVCDVGCGNGNDLRLFKELGYKTIGIDPDPSAREAAKDSGDIFPGTAENLPKELVGKKFEVVLMSHVLEHCNDPSRAIANAKSLLAPNGTLIVEVPNNAAIAFSTFKAHWPWSDIPRHLNFFTDNSLQKLLSCAALSVEKIFYVGYARQFMPDWLLMQRNIWDKISERPSTSFELASWLLLARSMFAPPRKKFDSIRIHCKPKH
jgi:SAM-dependent methyltransferase